MAFWKGDGPHSSVSKADLEWMFSPPFTGRIVMTDRADNSLWLLTFNTDVASVDGFGYISILQPVPTGPDKGNFHVYGPYDGPHIRWIDTPKEVSQGADPKPNVIAKLLIRGGYLGYERVTQNVSNGRVMARKRTLHDAREIIRPTTYEQDTPFDVMAWRPMEF